MRSFRSQLLWPCHPRDVEPDEVPRGRGYTSLYLGAAGVVWALDRLTGSSPLAADGLLAAFEAEPDMHDMRHGLLLGEAGIALVAYELAPSPALADRLERAIRDTIPRAERELLWSAPGAIHAALAAHRVEPDDRWLACVRDAVDELWSTLEAAPHSPARIWTQDLYGKRYQTIGLAHGFAGNAHALLRAARIVDDPRHAAIVSELLRLLLATGVEDELNAGRVNWPTDLASSAPLTRVQICHGAPGIAVALAAVPLGESPRIEELLVAAGETTWAAGPIERGPGLCHGTAGNGVAFLKLFTRTGDERWLERARAFAMHALGQCARERETVGHGRHSLWTGDLFLPFYVDACAHGTDEVAGLELL